MKEEYTAEQRSRDEFVDMVCKKHYQTLLLLARKLCSQYKFDVSQAGDLVNDFFLKVLTKHSTVSQGYAENGFKYLSVMLRYEMIDLMRHRKSLMRKHELFYDKQLPDLVKHPRFSLDSDIQLVWEEIQALLRPVEFDTHQLFLDGYSYREIAEKLGIPQGTVGTHLSRARKKIDAKKEVLLRKL